MKISEQLFAVSSQQYDVVGFDWDGTIVDSVPYKIKHNQHLAAAHGNHLTHKQVRTIWNNSGSFADLMESLTGSTDMVAIMAEIEQDYDAPEFAKRKFDFTPRLLREIGKSSFRAALLTSASRKILELDQDLLNIDVKSYFDFVQTADDTEFKKPNGQFFAELIAQTGVDPARAIYVGDELKDGLAARSAGLDFIGVETGMATRDEFMSKGFKSVRSLGRIAFEG